MTADDRPDPAALRYVLRQLHRVVDEADAQERHAILVTDPQTGSRHTIGPYADRFTARVARLLIEARNRQADPELGDLTYEVVPHFDPEYPGG